jgi:hypothetical protein
VSATPFFRPWLGWVALGEFVGFLVPLAAESLIIAAGLPDLPGAGLLVVAGLGEGASLGAAMAWRFSRRIPALGRGRFVLFSVLAAAVAWALGMLPVVTAEAWIEWPVPVTAVLGLVVGLALLASIGVGQWLELRRHLRGAGLWILATAAAWCAGLAAFFVIAPPLWSEGQPLPLVLAIGALGAAAMALVMAAVTGWAATSLVRRTRAGRPE